MSSKVFLTFIFFVLFRCATAQKEIENIISEILEQTVSNNPNDSELNTTFENLTFYYTNKLNINTLTASDLKQLYFLSDLEIQMILSYRESLKEFVELEELLFAGLSKSTFNSLKHFITLKHPAVVSSLGLKDLKNGKHQFFSRYYRVLENQEGYSKQNGYIGNPNKVYMRYQFNLSNTIKAGFVLEKDAGEKLKNNPSEIIPIDYKNAYFQYQGKTKIKTLLLGAYSLRIGQGLLAWNGFSLGKSSLLNLPTKSSNELNSYNSANESNFLRGVATQFQMNKTLITPYFSYKKIDSKITFDSTNNFSTVIPIVGFHRTESELESRNTNKEFISGISAKRDFNNLQTRINYQFLKYKVARKAGVKPYQTNDFNGNNLHAVSVDYRFRKKKVSIYGEFALQSKHQFARLTGFTLRPSSNLTLNIIHRNYSLGYFTPYNAGFGEKSQTKNETGIYFSLEQKIGTKTTIKVFTDYYHRKSPSFESLNPYSGSEFFTQIEHLTNSHASQYVRFSRETNNASKNLSEATQHTFHKMRYHINLTPNQKVSLRTRIELNHTVNHSFGHLFYQDMKYYSVKTHTTFSMRYARFKTPDFSQAIYAYENDVLFFFNTPAYYNNGTRVFLMTNTKIGKHLKVWVKISRWLYEQQNEISSGNSKINGNRKTDIRIQTQLIF